MKRRAVALCLVAAACGGGSLEPAPCETGHCATQASTRKTYQSSIDRKVDVLFVVDDTAAMAPYAATLPARFAEIAQALTSIPPPPPISFHAGFIRSGGCDATARGGACGITAPEQFLRAEWCETITNGTLAIADTFACLGDLGAVDCGPAQPLSAALHLLSGPPAGWEGFLRPEAYLLIVVVAAQDDASGPPGSPTAVADLVAAIKAVKPDGYLVAVSVISPQVCPAGAVATPRLDEFAQSFGASGLLMSLCDATFTPAISILERQINASVEPACLANVRDTDPQTPGLQADCTVISQSLDASGTGLITSIPSCDRSAPPCWRLGPAVCRAGNGGSWVISVDEPPDWCAEAGMNFSVECLSCVDPNDPACAVPAQ